MADAFRQATKVITEGMQNAGLLARGQTVTAPETADYIGRLNNILMLWQTQGLKLWTNYQQILAAPVLQAGKKDYSIGPSGDLDVAQPKRIFQGIFVDSGGSRRPLDPLGREEYERLSILTQSGALNSYYFDKKIVLPTISFWMAPDTTVVTGSVELTLQRPVSKIITDLDEIDLPDEWFMALAWALADDICTGQPQAIMDRCFTKATLYRTMVEDWDVEDAPTRFQPDPQMSQGVGRFR